MPEDVVGKALSRSLQELLAEVAVLRKRGVNVDLFAASIAGVRQNIARVIEGAGARQELIERQIEATEFGGELHDAYHDALERLHGDLDNLFTSLKTLLNRAGQAVHDALPHEQRHGLRTKSFGSFITSVKAADLAKGLRRALLRNCAAVEEVADYRDKFVEHAKSGQSVGLSSRGGGVTRVHLSRPPSSDREPKPAVGDDGPMVMKMQDAESGHYIWYVHCRPLVAEGDHIDPSTPVGAIDDGGAGHFERHGAHGHEFTSPGAPFARGPRVLAGEVLRNSPDPEHATEIVLNYCRRALRAV